MPFSSREANELLSAYLEQKSEAEKSIVVENITASADCQVYAFPGETKATVGDGVMKTTADFNSYQIKRSPSFTNTLKSVLLKKRNMLLAFAILVVSALLTLATVPSMPSEGHRSEERRVGKEC